jgi:transcriptional regulator with XRE-family HTH domain
MSSDRNKEILAANIKKYMEQKGVSNQQLCDDLNFKYTTFMDWIKAVTYPRMPKVEAMANYFGVKKSDLIEEKTPEQIEVEKKASSIAEAVLKMKSEPEFLSLIEKLMKLESSQIRSVDQMLITFLK